MSAAARCNICSLTRPRAVQSQSTALSLEQWYMVFSLLSAATSGPDGREHAWQSVGVLVEEGLVDDSNFTPCRHLLMRFLHG